MANWEQVRQAAPDLARQVEDRFKVRKHATLATLREDESPRISGTEVVFTDGQVVLGSMPGAVKELDLRRDPRLALHSPTAGPPPEDPSFGRVRRSCQAEPYAPKATRSTSR